MPLLGYPKLTEILIGYTHPLSISLAVRVGSQVYGNSQEDSDTDFVVINRNAQKSDLLFGADYNVTIFSTEHFKKMLHEQSIFAFEILHTPPTHRLYEAGHPIFSNPDPKRLSQAVQVKAQADWNKGLKIIAHDQTKGQKKLWHSLRLLIFARQLITSGLIHDFTEANELFWELITHPSREAQDYSQWLLPIRNELHSALKQS